MLDITKKIKEIFKSKELTATATVKGVEFVFGPTSNRDEYLLAGEMSEEADSASEAVSALGKIRMRTIASMLKSVDGVEIPDIVQEPGDGDKPPVSKERVLYLLDMLSEMPATVVTSLHLVCIDLKKKIRKDIRESVQYDWFGENLIEKDEKEEEAEAARIRKEELRIQEENEKLVVYNDTGEIEKDTPSFVTPDSPILETPE